MTDLGRVREIWVFPVKSMAGTRVGSAGVDDGGLLGDRSWAVVDAETGEPVTAAHEPRLREVVTHLVDGELSLDLPDGAAGLSVVDAGEAVSAWLGRALRLAHRDGTGFVDVAPVHLVSTRSTADAAHAEECDSCDVAAPRANLVLDLEVDTDPERDWVGRTVEVGTAHLHVVRRPEHCLGVYADVPVAGEIRSGDVVASR